MNAIPVPLAALEHEPLPAWCFSDGDPENDAAGVISRSEILFGAVTSFKRCDATTIDVSCELWVKGVQRPWEPINSFGFLAEPEFLRGGSNPRILVTGGLDFEVAELGEFRLIGVCGDFGNARTVSVTVNDEVCVRLSAGSEGRFFSMPLLAHRVEIGADASIELHEEA